ncbi:MAG: hypothetical protein CVU59_10330 [Deltaproteobacteria bacterium HGW-Deltaproteobacteria-17]|nr:MAG: hypothetical protein CVU59_10330 [Deltaproteobacteria bacterium HGW-Deltaproteobacteria-17]
MKKTVRRSRRLLRAALPLALFALAGFPLCACTGEEGSSLGTACQSHADCPNPARQRCVPEWGVCVGQTNELGDLDEFDAGGAGFSDAGN